MTIKTVYLADWVDFASALQSELRLIGHNAPVLYRNFDIETYDLDEDGLPIGPVNRYDLVVSTGTDRDRRSPFWDAPTFDYDHGLNPASKKPDEIIYAFLVDHTRNPIEIIFDDQREIFDLTSGLGEHTGITIYNAMHLTKVARNEYWFNGNPLDAAMLVFLIK